LVEIDVTNVTEALEESAASGHGLSFFAWMVKAIADCIAKHPHVQASMARRRRLVVFEDVDICVILEKAVHGTRVPLPLVIRGANRKPAHEIQAEIRAAQKRPVGDEGDFVLSENRFSGGLMRAFYALPQFARLLVLHTLLRSPWRKKNLMGTAMVTSTGSIGRIPGWVIPKSMHDLCFALGSVIKKPWVVDERIEIRDILHLTVLFNHDTVDGGPATRFIAQLVKRIEKSSPEPVA
jgi:pyruvate/2-oxoglutarate dehydrogenase complex dihydrolipoamide acyltransferase (E2) component